MHPTLTPAQIADVLQQSRYTTVQQIKAGAIPGGFQVVPGGPWRVLATTFEAWLAERSAPLDPHRIEPRSTRSRAAQSRRQSA